MFEISKLGDGASHRQETLLIQATGFAVHTAIPKPDPGSWLMMPARPQFWFSPSLEFFFIRGLSCLHHQRSTPLLC